MAPIIGIIASSLTGFLNNNSYESIATATISGSTTSTITFNSIPSTYTHLQIRGITQCTFSPGSTNTGGSAYRVRFNNDATGPYSYHQLQAYNSGSGANTTSSASQTEIRQNSAWATVNGFTTIVIPFVMDILDYTNTNKNKTIRTTEGFCANNSAGTGNGNQYVLMRGGMWVNTSAISRIDLISDPGYADGYWSSKTHIALYGIKG